MVIRRTNRLVAAGILLASGIAPAQTLQPAPQPDGIRPQLPTPPGQSAEGLRPPAEPQPSTTPGALPLPAKLVPLPPPAQPVTGKPPVPPNGCELPGSFAQQPRAVPRTWGNKSWKQKIQDCFLGRPEEFCAPPLGATIAQHFQTQTANGVLARMTLYDFDFVCGTDKLNFRGKDRLRQLTCLLAQTPFPVVIERTPHSPELADARRLTVLNELLGMSGTVPPERVVIGSPLAIPLHGVEAERIYQNLLQQTIDFGFPLYNGLYGGGAGGGISPGTTSGGGSPLFGGPASGR